jgi:hypothetical protein
MLVASLLDVVRDHSMSGPRALSGYDTSRGETPLKIEEPYIVCGESKSARQCSNKCEI